MNLNQQLSGAVPRWVCAEASCHNQMLLGCLPMLMHLGKWLSLPSKHDAVVFTCLYPQAS